MKYTELMKGISYEVLQEGNAEEITSLVYDSRRVTPGACCACEKGLTFDGLDFLEQDRQKGAAAAVADRDPGRYPEGLTVLKVENLQAAMPRMAANFYAGCLDGISVTGVTGTNGKTTTTTLMHHIFMEAGRVCGLIGTNENRIGNRREETLHTTPMPFDLFALFRQMKSEDVQEIVMEVSSHALHQHRVDTVPYDLAVFTNLTQDHLDYHKTMEEYRKAKTILFRQSRLGLLNGEDPASEKIREEASCPCLTYGLRENNTFSARQVEMSATGLSYDWYHEDKKLGRIQYPVPGKFNVYNTLAAASACYLRGLSPEIIIRALDLESPIVAGRFQAFHSRDGVTAIVDYAHTPDGLQNVLETVREFARGRVVSLFGCGGDRDAAKRPIMGRIAGEYSDFCILTSDNPRTEDPLKILDQIEEGIRQTSCPYTKIENRKQAIHTAIREARPLDVILVAGKGHEDYQIIGREKTHLDDREEVRAALQERDC